MEIIANTHIKISIENLKPSTSDRLHTNTEHLTLIVRAVRTDTDYEVRRRLES